MAIVMQKLSTMHLRLPRGTESLLLEEAARQRVVIRRLEELYDRWGYLPAQTPMVDFAELYQPLLPEENFRQAYRLIDREGELLMLRADITLFLAKQLGMRLSEQELPVRVCYADSILRYEARHDISKNEFFQSGVELIGVPGREGDLEMLLLLQEAVEAAGAERYALHLGSSAVLHATVRSLGAGRALEEELRALILGRRFSELRELLAPFAENEPQKQLISPERLEALLALYQLVGSAEEVAEAASPLRSALTAEEEEELDYLLELFAALRELKPPRLEQPVRLDLSEVGSRGYYTGVSFQAYVDRLDSAIASGGRYDSLLASFGFSAPSVGFSMLPRKIASLREAKSELPPVECAPGNDFAERYRAARAAHEEGRRASL
ncbi:MAG: ATP phosphoribosyltransferase regulatory subunit [Alkalispirochaetaceae bacterium]